MSQETTQKDVEKQIKGAIYFFILLLIFCNVLRGCDFIVMKLSREYAKGYEACYDVYKSAYQTDDTMDIYNTMKIEEDSDLKIKGANMDYFRTGCTDARHKVTKELGLDNNEN